MVVRSGTRRQSRSTPIAWPPKGRRSQVLSYQGPCARPRPDADLRGMDNTALPSSRPESGSTAGVMPTPATGGRGSRVVAGVIVVTTVAAILTLVALHSTEGTD